MLPKQFGVLPRRIAHDINIEHAGGRDVDTFQPRPFKQMPEAIHREEIDVVRRENAIRLFPQKLNVKAINAEGTDEYIAARADKASEVLDKGQRIEDMLKYLEANHEIGITLIARDIFHDVLNDVEALGTALPS